MNPPVIRFDDGAAYEQGMGAWSRLAGEIFLDWVAPPPGLGWVDVGCGNGAFTELLIQRCAPSEVQGLDPSEGQLAFARTRPGASGAVFQIGNAMALPFGDKRFGAATMALVIFFVPDPAKGVAEMVRVVRPGGVVAAYAWDILGGGFPARPIQQALRDQGTVPALPPSVGASRAEAMAALWTAAGLEAVETRAIHVTRSFASFDDYWNKTILLGTLKDTIAGMTPADAGRLKAKARSMVTEAADGGVTYQAFANAVKGRVPV